MGVNGAATGLPFRDNHLASVPVEHPDHSVHLVATEQRHDASGQQRDSSPDIAVGARVWPCALKKLSEAAGMELSISASDLETSLSRPDFLTSD